VATAAKLRYATTLRMRNMQTSLAVVVSVGLMLRLPVPVGSRKIKANRQLPSNTTFGTRHGEKLGLNSIKLNTKFRFSISNSSLTLIFFKTTLY